VGKEKLAIYYILYLVSINGFKLRLSQIIWVFHTNGKWPKDKLDHKDGNQRNNKIDNLREVNESQNQMNRRMRTDNKSGVTGVNWNIHKEKWHAQLSINQKREYSGYFDDFDKACQARWNAEDKYFGEFARGHSRPGPQMKDLFA